MRSQTAVAASSWIALARGLIRSMRPSQWTKNVIVYAGLVFDGKLLYPELFWRTTLVAAAFCLVSSSVYLLNDLVDIEKDRLHPRKRLRPLPSGELSPRLAAITAVILAVVGVGATIWLEPWVGAVMAFYLVQNVAYSFWLKNVVIVDVMVLSLGFLLRVVAGVLIVHVANFSPWLSFWASVSVAMRSRCWRAMRAITGPAWSITTCRCWTN
jgi:4-hydroxybenzoate polyprenyltransferase